MALVDRNIFVYITKLPLFSTLVMFTTILSRFLPFALFLFALSAQAAELTVSAAASLTNAFKEIGAAYEAQHTGSKVLFNFGASGALLQQMAKGAPVDVFASADQETMDAAQKQSLIQPASRQDFVRNTLVLILPADSKFTPKSLADLTQPAITRIAIGNPSSVPVGRYTRNALEAAKLWATLEPRFVQASNVRQALDYVARSEVDAGFVYATDAAIMKDKVRVAMTVPLDMKISYPIAVTSTSANKEEAARFISFIATPASQAVLAKYGFQKP